MTSDRPLQWPFRTRSETSGLAHFFTLKGALTHADTDLTVWEVSFSIGQELVVLDRTISNGWILRV